MIIEDKGWMLQGIREFLVDGDRYHVEKKVQGPFIVRKLEGRAWINQLTTSSKSIRSHKQALNKCLDAWENDY